MNQFRCKQFKPTVVLGITMLVVGFSTVTVEKAVSFQAETTVQLWTSTDQSPKTTAFGWGVGLRSKSTAGRDPQGHWRLCNTFQVSYRAGFHCFRRNERLKSVPHPRPTW